MKNEKIKNWLISGGVLLVSIGLILWAHNASSQPTLAVITNPLILPGIQTGSVPWIVEITHLRERLKDIGLPALSEEGTSLHIHQHLDIFINGEAVAVPAGIGINEQVGFISPIHVHDNSGIIHVESPTVQTFTLGQFFDIWGVKLTDGCIGGYCTNRSNTLQVFVKGAKIVTNPRSIALTSHQEIVITYGADAQLPKPIPSSFNFPAGD